jgi:hypothetical protein
VSGLCGDAHTGIVLSATVLERWNCPHSQELQWFRILVYLSGREGGREGGRSVQGCEVRTASTVGLWGFKNPHRYSVDADLTRFGCIFSVRAFFIFGFSCAFHSILLLNLDILLKFGDVNNR